MANIFIGRINVRSTPSSEYRTHPYSKRKHAPFEHKAAFQQLMLSAPRMNGWMEPLSGDEFGELDDQSKCAIQEVADRSAVFRSLKSDLLFAVDTEDQWVTMSVAEETPPTTSSQEVEQWLQWMSEELGITKKKGVEVYVDLVSRPRDVYERVTNLRQSGLVELTLIVRRQNPGGMNLRRFREQWLEHYKAQSAVVVLHNDRGEMDVPNEEVRGLSKDVGEGNLAVAAQSLRGERYESAKNPATVNISAEITPKAMLLLALALWIEEFMRGAGKS